ncbi:MAG: PAS domain S-box protein [Betaproteobacteria bacterium]|nr:PAS domain S-box protein [Betaproteobacteria bacterium]
MRSLGNWFQRSPQTAAVVAVALAFLAIEPLAVGLPAIFGDGRAVLLYCVPVLLAARLGGQRAGLVATLVAALLAGVLLALAYSQPGDHAGPALAIWLTLVLVGVLASLLQGATPAGAAVAVHASGAAAVAAAPAAPATAIATADADADDGFRELFDNAPVGAWIVNRDGRIERVNARLAALLGYRPEELVGRQAPSLSDPEDHRRFMQFHRGHLRALLHEPQTSTVIEKRYRHREGHPVWARVSVTAVGRLEDGSRRWLSVIEDIGPRKSAEAELQRSEERLQRLLGNLPEPVLILLDDRLAFVNPAAERLFQRARADLLEQPLEALVHADSLPALRARLAAMRADEAAALPLLELRALSADGSTRVVQLTPSVFESDGSLFQLVVLRDVDDLRRTESALEQYRGDLQRLLAARYSAEERHRRRMARELHDGMQQPLAAITMELMMLRRRLPAEQRALHEPLSRAAGMIDDLFRVTRQLIAGLRPQILDELGIEDALEVLAREFGERTGLSCTVEIRGDAMASVGLPMDAAIALYRGAQEALENAERHASARRVWLQLDLDAADGIRLEVSDDGRGLSAADLRKPGAFGLIGLRERLREFGGTLEVEARPEGGTRLLARVARVPAVRR